VLLASRMSTGERAALVGGTLCVPGELLAELLVPLRAHHDACRGITAPPASAQPRWSPTLHHLTEVATSGAIAHRQRTRETVHAFPLVAQTPSASSLDASAPAGSLSMDGKVVSVAVAAEMLGKSHQWVRRLATTGALPGAHKGRGFGNGRETARICWRIPLTAVHAYRADRGVV
jgi:hypothetical protein